MSESPTRPELVRKLRSLERRLEDLERAPRLTSASIGRGGITVDGGDITIKDGGGNVVAVLGTTGLDLDGTLAVDGTIEIDGGSLVVKDGGGTTVLTLGTAGLDLDGTLTVDGTVESGNYSAGTTGYQLDGSTGDAEFNSLTLRDGIVGLDALATRVETETYYTTGFPNATTSDSISLTVSEPAWGPSTVSVLAIGNVGMVETDSGTRFTASIDIDGNTQTATQGSTSTTYDAAGQTHARTFSADGSSFDVELSFGAAPISETPDWQAYLAVLVIWTS